jgi:hypothetical protein
MYKTMKLINEEGGRLQLHEIYIAHSDIEYICGTTKWINIFAI